ncbi:MAG TPA: M28 family peptidase [Fimbriimonadaceae bacterium]|nr:M28 family peptidase [Fimbriimonadaceae bacterium]
MAGAASGGSDWAGAESAVQGQSSRPTAHTVLRFDKAKAWQHLLDQVAFGPRYPGSEGHKKTRDWLVEQMKLHTENVRLQEFSHTWSRGGKKLTMWNVIGEQNWKEATTRVLLLAHWDTRPSAEHDPNPANRDKPILGANDGASGVAVLLELMRVTKDRLPKDVGVMYLMTDGEDLGPSLDEMFLGARHFAKNLPMPRPDYGILLDMIGDKDLSVPMEMNSLQYAEKLVREFYRHAASIGLGKTFPATYGPWIEDDHIPLNQVGLPTMDLIDFTYEPWHTVADTPDKCSAESLEKVGFALESWLMKRPAFRMK